MTFQNSTGLKRRRKKHVISKQYSIKAATLSSSYMIGKISHEQFLVHRGMVQFNFLPTLVAWYEISKMPICVVQLFVEGRELSHFVGVAIEKKEKRGGSVDIGMWKQLRVSSNYLNMGSLSILPSTVVEGIPKTLSIMCTKPFVLATSAWTIVALTPPPSTVMTSSSPSPLMLKYRKVWLLRVGTWAICPPKKGWK